MRVTVQRMMFFGMLLSSVASGAHGADAGSPACPQAGASPVQRILDHAKRIQDYVGLIDDKNQEAVRAAALGEALREADPDIRALAIRGYLRRFDALTPEVAMDPGNPVSAEDVPRLALIDVKWSDDASSFGARYASTCSNYGPAVRGQVMGGKLTVNFDGVCMRESLITKTQQKPSKGDPFVLNACQPTMAPNEVRTMLTGPLHCVGIPTVLAVQLPFGP